MAMIVGLVGTARASAVGMPEATVSSAASADPGVLAYGDAVDAGAPTRATLAAPVVGMAANPDSPGYWLVAADGGVSLTAEPASSGPQGTST
jgi:hypothetical protein